MRVNGKTCTTLYYTIVWTSVQCLSPMVIPEGFSRIVLERLCPTGKFHIFVHEHVMSAKDLNIVPVSVEPAVL